MATLKRSNKLLDGSDVPELLTKISKYSSDDGTRAFFLGQLLRSRGNPMADNSYIFKRIQEYIETNGLNRYYHQRHIPGSKSSWIAVLFVTMGLLFIVGGVFRLLDDSVTVSIYSRYNFLQVRGGGYSIVFGLILIATGAFRINYLFQQNRLLQKINTVQDSK